MNKKGWGLDYITLFVVLFVITVMIAVTHAPTDDIKQKQINAAITTLDWNSKFALTLKPNDGQIATQVTNIVYVFINALGYTFCEVAKIALNLALQNPQLNWMLIFLLLMLTVISPILFALTRIIVLFCILISEWIIQKKERRKLKNAGLG